MKTQAKTTHSGDNAIARKRRGHKTKCFIVEPKDVTTPWSKKFKKAGAKARLVLLNDNQPSDLLTSILFKLNIHSWKRIHFATARVGKDLNALRRSYESRFKAVSDQQVKRPLILDAQLINDRLIVRSTDFERLEVDISKVPILARLNSTSLESYEIHDRGVYIYWPDADIHLGWEQLVQIIDPAAALKAKQKSAAFNQRYGAAIRSVRETYGVGIKAIPGLSSRQLTRIEAGECRMTSAAAAKLAKAHGMDSNAYLNQLATALKSKPVKTA